jgi:hypothetical protein
MEKQEEKDLITLLSVCIDGDSNARMRGHHILRDQQIQEQQITQEWFHLLTSQYINQKMSEAVNIDQTYCILVHHKQIKNDNTDATCLMDYERLFSEIIPPNTTSIEKYLERHLLTLSSTAALFHHIASDGNCIKIGFDWDECRCLKTCWDLPYSFLL